MIFTSCSSSLDDKTCYDLYVYGNVKSTINSPISHKASSVRKLQPIKIQDQIRIHKIRDAVLKLKKMDIDPDESADFVLDFYCETSKKIEIYGNRAFICYNGEYFKIDDEFEDLLYQIVKQTDNKIN